MEPVLVLVAPPDVNLAPLTEQLWANRVAHRVVSVNGEQHLYLADPADAEQVKQWLQQWQQGELHKPDPVAHGPSVVTRFVLGLAHTPLTLLTAVAMVVVFVAMNFSDFWFSWAQPGADLWPGHKYDPVAYWQIGLLDWLKPTLLHFSVMHIVFNGMWWWILGRSIEKQDGSRKLLLLSVLCALTGNMAQWWAAGPGFGGMSGVTYGLMGWVGWRQLQRHIPYPIPAMLLPFMVVWLLLTMFGETLIPGLRGIANAAHIGGLATGVAIAAIWPLSDKDKALQAAAQQLSADQFGQSPAESQQNTKPMSDDESASNRDDEEASSKHRQDRGE